MSDYLAQATASSAAPVWRPGGVSRLWAACLGGRAIALLLLLLLGGALAQPLSYQAALDALAESPRLRLAQKQLELAERQLAISRAPLRAVISGGLSRTWGTRSISGQETALDDTVIAPLTVAAALNVIPYGPRFEATLRATWQLERARLALRDEWYGLIIELTESFQGALAAQLAGELQQQAVALARAQLEAVETRLAAGAASESERQSAAVALQQAEQELVEREQQRSQALAALSLLLGRPVAEVSGPLPTAARPPRVDAARLSQRSDVVAGRLRLEEAELGRRSTLRENLPSGRLQAQLQRTTEESRVAFGAVYGVGGSESFQPSLSLSFDPEPIGVIPGSRTQSLTVGLEFTIPLDAALPDALEAARLTVAQAELQLAQTLALAELELESRAGQLELARANLELAEALSAQRQAALAVAEARFALGVIGQLELESARLSAREAELAVMQAAGGVRLAAMRLAQALALNPLEVF